MGKGEKKKGKARGCFMIAILVVVVIGLFLLLRTCGWVG
jgi:hypothetical protein